MSPTEVANNKFPLDIFFLIFLSVYLPKTRKKLDSAGFLKIGAAKKVPPIENLPYTRGGNYDCIPILLPIVFLLTAYRRPCRLPFSFPSSACFLPCRIPPNTDSGTKRCLFVRQGRRQGRSHGRKMEAIT